MKSLLKLKNVDSITAFGNVIKYDEPTRTKIDLDEIRHHIVNICRYNGARQVRLAHHLSLCAYIARQIKIPGAPTRGTIDNPIYDSTVQAGYAAIHDFAEVYLGDIVSGFKKYLPDYKKFEDLWEPYVHNEIGLPWEWQNATFIKLVDNIALITEMDATDHPATERVKRQFSDIHIPSGIRNMAIKIINQPADSTWVDIQTAIVKAKTQLMVYDNKE